MVTVVVAVVVTVVVAVVVTVVVAVVVTVVVAVEVVAVVVGAVVVAGGWGNKMAMGLIQPYEKANRREKHRRDLNMLLISARG